VRAFAGSDELASIRAQESDQVRVEIAAHLSEDNFSLEFYLRPRRVIADEVRCKVLGNFDEFLERVRFDIQTGNVRRNNVITMLSFIEADNDGKAHEFHPGARDCDDAGDQMGVIELEMGPLGVEGNLSGLRGETLQR